MEYVCKEPFKTPVNGLLEVGDPVQYNQVWLDAGMIEEKPAIKPAMETKPQPTPKRKAKR
jgi:hypothetical protein